MSIPLATPALFAHLTLGGLLDFAANSGRAVLAKINIGVIADGQQYNTCDPPGGRHESRIRSEGSGTVRKDVPAAVANWHCTRARTAWLTAARRLLGSG